MKYVIINGSPRKKNTWSVVEQVKKNLDGDFEEIQLAKEKIPMCNGCTKCINDGESMCPHYELMKPIVDKMKFLSDEQLETISNLLDDLVKLNTQSKK